MNDTTVNFIRSRQIDSFQKLRLVLFLHQHPNLVANYQEFADQLYLGDSRLVEGIIIDLCKAGLLNREEGRFKLRHDSNIDISLECLTRAFEDPLARQKILDQIT